MRKREAQESRQATNSPASTGAAGALASVARDWSGPVALVAVVVVAGAVIRALEFAVWRDPSLWLNGEPLLPTHDAYAWIAGAEGVGRLVGWPMSALLAWLSDLTRASPALIAFWLPCVLAPLPGALVASHCIQSRRPEAALPAGLLAVSGLGYLPG